MYKYFVIITLFFGTISLHAQTPNPAPSRQRLDFAKTYFEYGALYFPSFTGKRLENGQIRSLDQPASINQYLTWGAFHFWGHAEFYVTIPLYHSLLKKDPETGYQLFHSVATGGRYYPWAMKENKIRPYVGMSWGALDFNQFTNSEESQPIISKDFMMNFESGIVYNRGKFGARIGLNYFPGNKWEYPLSQTVKSKIETPPIGVQVGIHYAFDATKNSKNKTKEEWNEFPTVSKLSYNSASFGDFFLGLGPSTSFSLGKSSYNEAQLPYLKSKLTSKSYFDATIGYHFNKANLFTAVSYRRPTFLAEGFGNSQTIRKSSFTLEVNKFLTDYSGFAPFIGLNMAYDNISYKEMVNGVNREFQFNRQVEPGITFGWDIVPGKTAEALILRTNLRWYPFSQFSVDGQKFNFSQLEYNLIQVVFYPQRLKNNKKSTSLF